MTSSAAAARSAGRPRCEATRMAVLRAAYDLLSESGIGRFTIEGVAGRSGVARTTIYRWWPSKGALAMEGLLEALAPAAEVPPGADAIAAIATQVRMFAGLLRGEAGTIIRRIIAEGQSDRETLQAFVAGVVTPRRQQAAAIMAHGVAAGELRPDIDAEMVMGCLYGPLFLRSLLAEPLDDAWVERLIKTVLEGCRSRPG